MKSPFKFLDPYQLEDRDAFFGRESEIKELYNLVTKNRLTFVYGPSGTGKTSLVQCGLASRFGGVDWLPLFVRRGDDINASLNREVGKSLGEGPAFDGDLPEAIGSLFNRYLRPVYLIFDQFEELFILGKPAEQQAFYNTIAELLDAELPCRLLFILREDYFGHLNQFEKAVPELYHRKLRVEPMSRDNLRAVITGSCKVFDIGFDDPRRSPELVMDNILADKSGIHMPYVQVYLHMLYQEMTKERQTSQRFSDTVIQKVGPITDVLGRFLQEQKTAISKTLQQDAAYREASMNTDAVSEVLDVFVSREGTKTPVGYHITPNGQLNLRGKAAQTLAVLPPALLSAILLELEKSRILRRSDDTLELAHDTLAALIDQQRSAELRQLRDIRQRIETGYSEHVDSKGAYFFDKGQLARIEPFLAKLALEPEQASFLENSRVEGERLENAEKERVQRELQLAEDKLAAEERARKRQRVFLWVVGAVAVLAIGALLYAWKKNIEAQEQTKLTNEQTKLATEKEDLANTKSEEARLSRDSFQASAKLAFQSAEETKAALLALGKTTIQVVDILSGLADTLILKMNYPAAAEKLKSAAALDKPTTHFRQAVQEVAFFWTEAGKHAQAAAFLRDTKQGSISEKREALRAFLKKMDANHYSDLENKYFGDMVPIKGGTFKFGKDVEDSITGIDATVSDFSIARTETTFWQYGLFCEALGRVIRENSVTSWGFEGHDPIIYVSWYDAVEYTNWLSVLRGREPAYIIDSLQRDTVFNKNEYDGIKWTVRPVPGANGYRLPTETEWEYAARGGQDFRYSGSDSLGEVAWYDKNSSRTHPVKTRKKNGFDLYDMTGNVWEWCWDWYGKYPEGGEKDYLGLPTGASRVLRGGSWGDYGSDSRLASRLRSNPVGRDNDFGFRVARH